MQMSSERYAEYTAHHDLAVLRQAHQHFDKWAKSNDIDDLWKRDAYDLACEMYAPYGKRDSLLVDAIETLIEFEKSEGTPVDERSVALANLRYEDAI